MSTFSTIAISALSGAAAAGAVAAVTFVELQPTSPGTPQSGHINVTGSVISGRVGVNTTPGLARLQINETGPLQGVRSISSTGVAVYGQSNAVTGLGAGGYFTSASAGGRALVAEQFSTTGNTVGGLFYSRSATGIAGYGKATSTSGANVGLLGETLSSDGVGVKASNTTTDGTGLLAVSQSTDDSKAAIVATNTLTTGSWGRAIFATGGGDNGDCALFECPNAGSGAFNYAVKARSAGGSGRGVVGIATDSTGSNYGVYGESDSGTNGYGVFSNGNTGASGTKSMVIDNPMDPANSVLKQYCAEGAEPLMVYSGTIKLGSNGIGYGQLPVYFDSIATNPRYSLTAIGAAMPNLHIGKKAVGNQFQVAGGVPNGEVSWTVFATRNDPWVKTYGTQTVIAKPASERGHYITPQLYGARPSAKMGIQRAEREALKKQEAVNGPN